MRTLDVTREFLEKTEQLAQATKIPEVKARLLRLAADYRRTVEQLERVESGPTAPK